MDELLQRVAVSHLFPATGNSNNYHKDAGTPGSGAQKAGGTFELLPLQMAQRKVVTRNHRIFYKYKGPVFNIWLDLRFLYC